MAIMCNFYSGLRVVRASGFYEKVGYATSGLPAGCPWSEYAVRIYCTEPFARLIVRQPAVRFDFCVDDFTFGAAGTHHQVVRRM